MKKQKLVVFALVLIMLLTACNKETSAKTETDISSDVAGETRIFLDSAGREVEIPLNVTKVAPTGVPSQMILFTAAPDKLIGIARQFNADSLDYLDDEYLQYTEFGQFYGKNANLNMEALIKAKPDVVIDMGEVKNNIKEDMDALQKQIGIPVVFLEASISTYGETYEKLGELLGMEAELKLLGDYSIEAITRAQEITSSMDDSEKVSVYMAGGDNGLSTNGIGSFHAQTLDIVGAENVAVLDASSTGSGNEVSFEQLLIWNPDLILAYTQALYDMITTDATWQSLEAVKNGRVYKIPTAPFNFITDPPSVNRVLGISWLGNLLYPDKYEFNEDIFKDFSKIFYHTELSDDEVFEILKNAQ